MKKFIFLSFFFFVFASAFSQVYYIEKTDDGYEQPIIDKLLEFGIKTNAKQENSDYTIKCVISKPGAFKAKGYVLISDSKTGDFIAKSTEAKGRTTAFNGYASPKILVMRKIADDYLSNLVTQLRK